MIILLVLFSQCYQIIPIRIQTYEGARLAKTEVGFLRHYVYLQVTSIDGVDVETIKKKVGKDKGLFEIRNYSYELLPGEHNIELHGVAVEGYAIRGTWSLKFVVEPGHEYYLRHEAGEAGAFPSSRKIEYVYIEDRTTGVIVAKQK